MIEYYIFRQGYVPSFQDLPSILEFHIIHHAFPTVDELFETIDRTMHIQADPDDYHQTYKVTTNTKNLEHLQEQTCTSNDHVCGLCQETITIDQSIFIIPPCNHVFHSKAEECIDTTIKTWLETNNKCPLCKQEVKIEI